MTLGCRRTLSSRAHTSLREGYTCTSPKANGARWDLWFLSGTALSFPFFVARFVLSALCGPFFYYLLFTASLCCPLRLSCRYYRRAFRYFLSSISPATWDTFTTV